MPAKIRLLFAFLAAALILSACSVPVFIGAMTDETVSSSTYTGDNLGSATVADSASLGAGEERVYRVNVSSTSQPALYVYLDADLELYLYGSSGSLIATSSSADFFAAGYAGLASTAGSASVSPSGIGAFLVCPGSCAIVESDADSHYYVRVVNETSGTVGFDLYAVTRGFEDTSEATSGREVVSTSVDGEGALETLGDEDEYVLDNSGTLALSGSEAGGLIYEAEISDPFGDNPTRTIRAGQSTSVLIDEVVRVYSVNGPVRASASANSYYALYYE